MLSLTHMPVRCCSAREYLCASSTTTTSPRRFPRIFQATTLCDHRCTQPQTGSMKSRIPARLLRLMPATELCSAWLSARGRGGVILGSRSQATWLRQESGKHSRLRRQCPPPLATIRRHREGRRARLCAKAPLRSGRIPAGTCTARRHHGRCRVPCRWVPFGPPRRARACMPAPC